MINDLHAEAAFAQPPAEAPASAVVARPRWYRQTWFIVTMLVALSPVGLILAWVVRPWQPRTRWIVTGVTLAYSVALIMSGIAVAWLVVALVVLLACFVQAVKAGGADHMQQADQIQQVPGAPTRPQIQVRQYKNARDYQRDATRMTNAGYEPQGQTATEGHMNVGRTAARWALVGPLALIGGGSRTKGTITVTWVKRPA